MLSLLSRLAVDYGSPTDFTTTSTNSTLSGGALAAVVVGSLVLTIFLIAAMWKVFQKAGKPGWAAIIPVYNTWVLFEIAGKPGWWALLSFIPVINIVALVLLVIACIEIAKRFGKSGVWGFFLLFLLPIFGWPILGFGKAQYHNPDATAESLAAAPADAPAAQTPETPQSPAPDAQLPPQTEEPTSPSDNNPQPPAPTQSV